LALCKVIKSKNKKNEDKIKKQILFYKTLLGEQKSALGLFKMQKLQITILLYSIVESASQNFARFF